MLVQVIPKCLCNASKYASSSPPFRINKAKMFELYTKIRTQKN